MRCSCCNKPIHYRRTYTIVNGIGETVHSQLDDFCAVCRNASTDEYSYSSDHEYQHKTVKSGITQPKPSLS